MSGSSDDHLFGVAQSAVGRSWVRRLTAAEERTAMALAQRNTLSDAAARVLAGRSVTTQNADTEMAPTIRALLPDPSTLTDCDRLVTILAQAIAKKRSIALFADYDVDGATSAAVVARVLSGYGANVRVMVPDRITDGYGPSIGLMEELKREGAELVICLDCGAGAIEPITAAKESGLDVLVIDHHPVDAIAPADAVVNPNRADDLSGLGDCAAVGVAFVVMVGLVRHMRREGLSAGGQAGHPDLMHLLDCVALGTVADVVPLTALNRAFVRGGLVAFRKRQNRGLAALTTSARIGGPVDAGHLGYVIGPRINAGGRIGEAGLGAKLLITRDEAEAETIASQLEELNTERRSIEARALEEAVALADETASLVVVSGEWHPGVVGLVASRLKERLRRPALAIALQDDKGVGSGRSIPGVDLGAAIRAACGEGLLVKGGGHAMAAGFTVRRDGLEAFKSFLTDHLAETVTIARAADRLKIDAVVGLAALDETLASALTDLGPWGSGRPRPVFGLSDVKLEAVYPVGQGDSLRLSLSAPCGTRASAMAFRTGGPLGAMLKASVGTNVHLAVELSYGVFRGIARPEITVIDVASPSAALRRAA
ncbi:MAG: single-stranded-DNA-specific exonuclease RecJ [Pseudomonadota bacterium]